MRDLLQEIYSKRVNKYQEGGQIDEKTQQEFLQYLAQVTGAKTDDQLKQVLSKLSQQQMEQLYQKFLAQKQQGVKSARNGGKLEYLQFLRCGGKPMKKQVEVKKRFGKKIEEDKCGSKLKKKK